MSDPKDLGDLRLAGEATPDEADEVPIPVEEPPVREGPPNPPIEAYDEEGRTQIEVGPRADEGFESSLAVLRSRTDVFARSGLLVRAAPDRKLGVLVKDLVAAALPPLISEHADYFRMEKKKDAEWSKKLVPPPKDWMASLVASGVYPGLRQLVGVTRSPIVLPDGDVVATPGFHEGTGLLYVPNGDPPPILPYPVLADAKAACAALLEVVDEFPMQTDADRSSWLALNLTLGCRSSFHGSSPLWVATANQARVGKTRCLQLPGLICKGRMTDTTVFPLDEDELRKRVDAAVLASTEHVLWDNVRSPIGGPALEMVLTSSTYSPRRLGKSEMPPCETLTVWSVSANGATFGGDAAPRSLLIRQFVSEPHPERRTFRKPDIEAWVLERRSVLLGHVITIVRAYLLFLAAGGEPVKLKPWGSFEGWSRVIRAALVWAGQPDPLETRAEIDQVDHASEDHDRLVRMIRAAFAPGEEFTVGRLAHKIDDRKPTDTLGEVVDDENGARVSSTWFVRDARDVLGAIGCWDTATQTVGRVKLGLRLKGDAGRPSSDGYRVVRKGQDRTTKSPTWAVQR